MPSLLTKVFDLGTLKKTVFFRLSPDVAQLFDIPMTQESIEVLECPESIG